MATAPEWLVPRTTHDSWLTQAWPTRADLNSTWQPLRQSWRASLEPSFEPGLARLNWTPEALHLEGFFSGKNQTNRARQLNERTWELGSIFEFFLRADGAPRYLELHVTPENQRLQLLWPDHGLDDFRAGRAALAEFAIADPAWVTSEVRLQPDHWCVRLVVPLSCLGITAVQPLPALSACVCRYDCGSGAEVLSSTAPLREPNYHRWADWPRLRLAD